MTLSSSKSEAFQAQSSERAKVLVVDDNIDLLKLISIRLRPLNFELKTVSSAEEALNLLAVWPADLVITDLQMPGMSGMELFEHLHRLNPLLPVIILTAHGTIPDAVRATQSGVASYLTKPFDGDLLVKQIQSALLTSGFTRDESTTEPALVYDESWRKNIVGNNPALRNLLAHIEKLADTDALIMIQGEPGVGKLEITRAMHARSNRSNKPFIQLNCAAIPDDLIEAEAFGLDLDDDQKQDSKIGLLRAAEGGTVFLSDFNEAPVAFLRKIIRAVIEQQAIPANSTLPYSTDVRVVIGTTVTDDYGEPTQELWNLSDHLDLTRLLVPPLRERREDIPLIVRHWLKNSYPDRELQFSAGAMQRIVAAEWPGNVRHLLNTVKQCALLTNTSIVTEAIVSSRIKSPIFKIAPLTNAHRDFERNYLTEVLKVTNGNVTQAASIAKRNRTEFHRLLKKHKIEAKSFRKTGSE